MTEHEIEKLLTATKGLESSKELIKSYSNGNETIELNVVDKTTIFIEFEVVQKDMDNIINRFVSNDYEECSVLFDKLMNFKDN